MKQKFVFIAFVTAGLLFSCQKEKQEPAIPSKAIKTTAQPAQRPLFLNSFTDLPTEIDGCSCLFSSDSLDFKHNRYLYANNFAETAFVKLNGIMVKFIEVSHQKKDSLTTFSTYKAEGLEMHIETRQTKQIDYELMEETGTITVKRNDGQTITKTFYGECGC